MTEMTKSRGIEKRRTPGAVLARTQKYVRLAAPEQTVLRAIGEESIQKATHTLTSKGIEQVIKATRKKKPRH
jgi:hypothetical protein